MACSPAQAPRERTDAEARGNRVEIIAPPLIPELDVADLERSLAVYVRALGFTCALRRQEERFAYLIREDAHLMLEEASGPGRRFCTAPLEFPFGRGLGRVLNWRSLFSVRCV